MADVVVDSSLAVDDVTASRGGIWGVITFWGLHAWVLAYCGVVLSAFYIQFAMGEFPCPLCMLQRYGMFLSSLGALFVIMQARRGELTTARYAQGLGMGLIGVLAGASVSVRQILLHIKPGDEGYGDPVLGIHLYTWAFITFVIGIAGCAILLLFRGQFEAGDTGVLRERGWLRLFTIAIITWVTLNLAMLGIGVLPDCGLGMCPTDPASSVGIGTVGGFLMFLAIILVSFATGTVLNRRMQSGSNQ